MIESYEQDGWDLKNQGKDAEAIKSFDKAIENKQEIYFAYHGKGECLMNLEKYDEALACFEAAIKINPKHNVAYYDAGKIFYYKGQFEAAKSFFNMSIKCNGSSVTAWLWRGKSLVQLHRYEDALKSFSKAMDLAILYRHDLLSEIDQCKQEISDYQSALEKEIERLKEVNEELQSKQDGKETVIVNGNIVKNKNVATDNAIIHQRQPIEIGQDIKQLDINNLKKCPDCGTKIVNNAKFCHNCGGMLL